MELQRSPNSWSCLPTSLAILIGRTVQDVIQFYSHDGSEKVNDLPEPYCYRGFTVTETFDVAYKLGWLLTDVDVFPHRDDINEPIFSEDEALDRLELYLYHPGLLCGKITEKPHATAWDGKQIYDPTGFIYPLERMEIHRFLILSSFKR